MPANTLLPSETLSTFYANQRALPDVQNRSSHTHSKTTAGILFCLDVRQPGAYDIRKSTTQAYCPSINFWYVVVNRHLLAKRAKMK